MSNSVRYNEKELNVLIADGDEAAFFQLVSIYTPPLKQYLLRYTGSAADAEEILQDVFIRIWLNRDKLPEVAHLSGWIYTIAARLCITYLRARTNRRQQAERLAARTENIDHNTPDIYTQVSQMNAVVQQTLAQMSTRRRQIFEMNRYHGLKPAEIAQKLSTQVGTVKNQLSAALREIREALEAAGMGWLSILLFFIKIW